MKVIEGDYRTWEPLQQPTAVTVGVYDGVHLGHQSVLRALRASGLPVAVVTFADHPLRVIAPNRAPKLLMSIERRLELLEELGVTAAAVIGFDDHFRLLPPEEFVEKVLVTTMRARRVAVGRDFRFGFEQLGDIAMLEALARRYGFEVDDVAIFEEGIPVRSTVIRALLAEGDVAAGGRLLGRPHRLAGMVVPGDRRGSTIGFPTANMDVPDDLVVPGSGVYAGQAIVDGRVHNAVVNIGNRPTFGGTTTVVETHVLDFDGDLYGQTIAVDFVARLRSEHRFSGIEELVEAINHDVETARGILEGR
jgi:riboflavin kinase/FMN adenylyltransferase